FPLLIPPPTLSTLFPYTTLFRSLFIDDFVYTNPLLQSQWTIDRYTTNSNPGLTSSSGYMIMSAQTTSGIETVHVTTPIYDPNQYTSGQAVKRKMTVTMIPFSKNENPSTGIVQMGIGPLYNFGTFPGTTPYAT